MRQADLGKKETMSKSDWLQFSLTLSVALAAGQIPQVHLDMGWEIYWIIKMPWYDMTHTNLYSVSVFG